MKIRRALLSPFALIATLLATTPLHALPTDKADSVVTSPELSADRKLTLRLRAPNAAAVHITGDFIINGAAMTKDATGVWTYTTPSLPPAMYGYFFSVDGVRMVDPGNLFVTTGSAHLKSYVEIPGDKDHPEFWEIRDVPHGTLHEELYKSPDLGNRRAIVYTPPGYDAAAATKYPVIYLLHAATDNETFWMRVGRANYIMDNLLADGKAKPAIVVSCFGHPTVPIGPEDGPDGSVYYVNEITKDMMECIIPRIEKQYRARTESKDRAILGFSGMGGCQALTIGLNHPGTFGYIAGLSSGFRANQNLDANFKPMLADIEKAKTAFKLVKIEVGLKETGNVTPSQMIDRYLTTKAIPHTFVTTPEGFHSWISWRGYFRDFMTEIFRD